VPSGEIPPRWPSRLDRHVGGRAGAPAERATGWLFGVRSQLHGPGRDPCGSSATELCRKKGTTRRSKAVEHQGQYETKTETKTKGYGNAEAEDGPGCSGPFQDHRDRQDQASAAEPRPPPRKEVVGPHSPSRPRSRSVSGRPQERFAGCSGSEAAAKPAVRVTGSPGSPSGTELGVSDRIFAMPQIALELMMKGAPK